MKPSWKSLKDLLTEIQSKEENSTTSNNKSCINKDFSELHSKLGFCLSQVVPMTEKLEELSRNVFEVKEECKKLEYQIITKAEKDSIYMLDSR